MSVVFDGMLSAVTVTFMQPLISACIKVLAWHFEEMITSEEWEKEWLSVDRDQLTELLRSNDLLLPSNSDYSFLFRKSSQYSGGTPSHPLSHCSGFKFKAHFDTVLVGMRTEKHGILLDPAS